MRITGDFVVWFLRFLQGFVRVRLSGKTPEKILNAASESRIYLWDSRITPEGIESFVSVKDFKALRSVLQGSGAKIHILKKCGMPFKIYKNRKRAGIAAGLAIFLIFLKFMSGFIWIIEVTGNTATSTDEIISAAEKIGIHEGLRRSDTDPKARREKLLLQINTLAWASLNVEGCRLTVNVSEIKNSPSQKDSASNLKAAADGIITKIDVNSGDCLVKTGDTVKKGDILVSGITERDGGTEFVRSSGSITAVTGRSVTVSGKYRQTEMVKTGEKRKKTVLELFGAKIPLYPGKETRKYDFELNSYILSVFGQKMPIKAHTKTFYYLEEHDVNYSEEALCEKLQKEIDGILKKEKVENYTIENREIEAIPDGISLTLFVTAEENIALPEPIIVAQSAPR